MLVNQLMAELSVDSKQTLADIVRSSPVTLEFSPVEVMASVDSFDDFEFGGESAAITLRLETPFDSYTQSSPVVMLLQSTDFDFLRSSIFEAGIHDAWPYQFLPYMRLTNGSVVRRRHIVAFLNSISDTLNRNPLTLIFDNFYTTAVDVPAPPFEEFFMNYRGLMV